MDIIIRNALPVTTEYGKVELYKQTNVPEIADSPIMGWSTWRTYGLDINEQKVKDIADFIISSGLDKVGYKYVLIDAGWNYIGNVTKQQNGSWTRDSDGTVVRNSDGIIQYDSEKFPNGISSLATYVHGLGLKLGIYSSPGRYDCVNAMGSMDYEEQDANTYASWGIDYLKYDYCTYVGILHTAYYKMAEALQATGRDFVLYLCTMGVQDSPMWACKIGHQVRLLGDSSQQWNDDSNTGEKGMITCYETALSMQVYNKKNCWIDTDTVGIFINNTRTLEEKKTHFALNCMLNLPLILEGLPSDPQNEIVPIASNMEMISIDRDTTSTTTRQSIDTNIDVLTKMLKVGMAICILNKSVNTYTYSGSLKEFTSDYTPVDGEVINENTGLKIADFGQDIELSIPSHGCIVLRLN